MIMEFIATGFITFFFSGIFSYACWCRMADLNLKYVMGAGKDMGVLDKRLRALEEEAAK